MFSTKKVIGVFKKVADPRPETYRGRVYDPYRMVWYFPDGSGTVIADEVREEEMRGLITLQEDNMDAAHRLFRPSDFESRKRK